jgi:uncharacterized OB-fold protein
VNPALHSIGDYFRGYGSEHRLRGFRSSCGFVTVTWGLLCPQCGRADLEEVDLKGEGRVAAYTVQNVPGDEFRSEAPYAYVIVELDGGGRLTGWMPDVGHAEALQIGDRVRWVPSPKPGVVFERVRADSGETPLPRRS